ncbi:MAG: hypothetical protein AVDCRST_MAG49-2137 [uncultured Thermomicrobiales bacterium]|uniref:Uncharacterized protein n=1 Tax=uncultured Thermomicrobiales bacterium TaxID=1645740 RepID=A0A6J4UPU9_9BACT|nr:MAG: hypothetical protein AVDCRST_MAG49-2137 [uncultured Thermomicrobiales bacterium]
MDASGEDVRRPAGGAFDPGGPVPRPPRRRPPRAPACPPGGDSRRW